VSKKSKRHTDPWTPPPAPPPIVPRTLPTGSREALSEALAALAAGPHHRTAWMHLCAHVEAIHRQHGDATEAIVAVQPAVSTWPARLRMAPWLWINKLVAGALPAAALGLVSGLPVSAAIGDNAAQNPRREALIAWLRALPATAPALDALVLSWRTEARLAIETANAREPDATFHATVPTERAYHWEEGILEALLGSPLARDLSVFDASLAVPVGDYTERTPGVVDGNTAAFTRVLALLGARTRRLAHLDLRGNVLEHGADRLKARYALPALRVLDVGMSAPLGDDLLTVLAAGAPSLEALHTVPDCTGSLLDAPFEEFSDDEKSNVERYWSLADPTRPARFTAAGVKTLLRGCPALKLLVLQSTYRRDEAIAALLAAREGLVVDHAYAQGVSLLHGAWPLASAYDLDEPA
jgi:hypothetical protein